MSKAECPHFTILIEPVMQEGASERFIAFLTATCRDCGKTETVDAWQESAQADAVLKLIAKGEREGAK